MTPRPTTTPDGTPDQTGPACEANEGTVLSVRGALGVARTHCPPACFAYHASWRITRLAGLKGNPRWHVPFYRDALTPHLKGAGASPVPTMSRVRVLVCGTADETMLAVLAQILGPDGFAVHVLDACRTPLVLCQAYVARRGMTVRFSVDTAPRLATLTTDRRGSRGRFDVIVTDGLLSLLPDEESRTATLARLANLLAPDGTLLYTTRITTTRITSTQITGTRITGTASGSTAGAVAERVAPRLEYDRLGQLIQALVTRMAWRHTAPAAAALAAQAWRRPARTAPFQSADDLAAAFAGHFADVHLVSGTGTASWPVRVHPARLFGRGSRSVGVVARHQPPSPLAPYATAHRTGDHAGER